MIEQYIRSRRKIATYIRSITADHPQHTENPKMNHSSTFSIDPSFGQKKIFFYLPEELSTLSTTLYLFKHPTILHGTVTWGRRPPQIPEIQAPGHGPIENTIWVRMQNRSSAAQTPCSQRTRHHPDFEERTGKTGRTGIHHKKED